MEKLKILLPKGRIYENVAALFSDAGIAITLPERAYRPTVNQDDIEAKVMKPQNIGKLLELGAHDVGFTGADWIAETGARVEEIMDLGFDRVRIVAAAPAQVSDGDLRKKRVIAATEYVNIAESWLKGQGLDAIIIRTYGATEVFPPDDADIIIDNTSTGRTLQENGLRIVDTVMESSTRLFASRAAMEDAGKKKKIFELKMLFESVLAARGRVMLEMNVPAARLDSLVAAVPAMKSPTIAPLYGGEGYAVKIVAQKEEAPRLLPRLKELGASDILEYTLRKVMP